ncbi:type IV pilus twitching motility protein PilT [Brassicibacter mesophilus]|uniref:type IV pilus twitching motility protein PilT n=1 Tax=Brassicibacter mesophilus TaxID=745119 RepID=UPI003D191362
MDMHELLQRTIEFKASDLHITVGSPPILRINGELKKIGDMKLTPEDTLNMVKSLADDSQFKRVENEGEIDMSFSYPGIGRFRVNIYKQRGSYGIAIRSVALEIPNLEELGLPSTIAELSRKQRGLILVTGPTGSGKSTTLASMVDIINKERSCHILTLEDPIEYLHKHNKSIINQREIGHDSKSFGNSLRAALRQDPDVILVGEMRDLETVSIAITAAETGHLVLSTLHTLGSAKTIDRIIDVFPPHQKQQIVMQLSTALEGIVSQQLLPKQDNSGRVVALEILVSTPAIRNLIREGKTHQIPTAIQTGAKFGMNTMDNYILDLYKKKIISRETAITNSLDNEMIKRQLGL